MDRNQINQLNMMDTVDQVLTTFNATWSSNPAISAIVSKLRLNLKALNDNDTLQKTISTGITQTKEEAKAVMITAAILTANAGKSYASITGNTNLKTQMTHTKTEIKEASDTDADDICQNIHDNINSFISSMAGYGADATTQTNLQNAIDAYSTLIGKPREQIGVVADATINIAENFETANTILKDELDTIMMQFTTSSASFYNKYMSARVIVNIGHRHTVTLKGFIYDTHNNALEGALVELTGDAEHSKTTLATGKYNFTRLHTGTYTLKVSKSGFVMQTKTLTVTANGTIENDFDLAAVGGGGTNNSQPAPVSGVS